MTRQEIIDNMNIRFMGRKFTDKEKKLMDEVFLCMEAKVDFKHD